MNSPLSLLNRYRQGVEFHGKYIGSIQVDARTGEEMCQAAMVKLRARLKQTKEHKPLVIVRLTDKDIQIINQDTERLLESISVHHVSYVLPDAIDQHAFGFVCGPRHGPYVYHAFKTVSQAISCVVRIRELFEALAAVARGDFPGLSQEAKDQLERYKDGIEFRGKFVGVTPVDKPDGAILCYETLAKMRQKVKESNVKKTRVAIRVDSRHVAILNQDSGDLMHSVNLDAITFITPDAKDEHAFGFIAGGEKGPWKYYGFKTVLASIAPVSVIADLLSIIGTDKATQDKCNLIPPPPCSIL